jgi:hypothetical protein
MCTSRWSNRIHTCREKDCFWTNFQTVWEGHGHSQGHSQGHGQGHNQDHLDLLKSSKSGD